MKAASVGFIVAVLATCAAGVFVGRHFNIATPEPTGSIGVCRLSVNDCYMTVT